MRCWKQAAKLLVHISTPMKILGSSHPGEEMVSELRLRVTGNSWTRAIPGLADSCVAQRLTCHSYKQSGGEQGQLSLGDTWSHIYPSTLPSWKTLWWLNISGQQCPAILLKNDTLISFIVSFCCWDRVSCSPGQSVTHCVPKDDL